MTLPGIRPRRGTIHPIHQIRRQIEDVFLGLGYSIEEGPEIETDYYNFVALNVPKHHPAGYAGYLLYRRGDGVAHPYLPVQVRSMEKAKGALPLKMICPGKVYRKDDDATTRPCSFKLRTGHRQGHLSGRSQGNSAPLCRELFGPRQQIRLRPSFFPFTEPSVEVDILCTRLRRPGLPHVRRDRLAGNPGGGNGASPVLEMSGYDPKAVSGFAFGLGIDRVAMLKYGIQDIRHMPKTTCGC